MLHRIALIPGTFAVVLSLAACDCGSSKEPPGPARNGFESLSATSIATLGVRPFDVDRNDLAGPTSHDAQYGKTPEIIVAPSEDRLDVLLRSTDEAMGPEAFWVRIEDDGGVLSLERAYAVPTLGLVLGFVRADDGSFYYATGTPDDDISQSYPAEGQHRANVVRVYHVSDDGEILFELDLDLERELADEDCEPIVNPATAASARLGYAGNTLALVAGNNTAPDDNGTRHQKALTTLIDATTGAIQRTSSIWVSHSFDQRYLRDGSDLYELHLGDAYPRTVVTSRLRGGGASGSFHLFHNKGNLGANNTFTRLGNMVRTADGSFLVLIATERTTETSMMVNGARDLALLRLVPDFASGEPEDALDDTFGSTFTVTSSGESRENRVLFLTSFQVDDGGDRHAERPKLLPIGGDEYIVLFERWSTDGNQTFEGTYALRIDADGAIGAGPTRVSDHHLPRGDDAFVYGGDAAWLTGDQEDRTLTLHVVDRDLAIEETVVP